MGMRAGWVREEGRGRSEDAIVRKDALILCEGYSLVEIFCGMRRSAKYFEVCEKLLRHGQIKYFERGQQDRIL